MKTAELELRHRQGTQHLPITTLHTAANHTQLPKPYLTWADEGTNEATETTTVPFIHWYRAALSMSVAKQSRPPNTPIAQTAPDTILDSPPQPREAEESALISLLKPLGSKTYQPVF